MTARVSFRQTLRGWLASRRVHLVLWVLAVVSAAVLGYILIEGYTLAEAVYMVAITLSTVGYGEVRPLSPAGRWLTVGVIVVGVGTGAYVFTALVDYIVSGQLQARFQERQRMKTLEKMRNHVVVCGFGRVGQQVVEELQTTGVPVVVIDHDPEALARCERLEVLAVAGDATDDEILLQAGIARAKGLVTVLESDADNLFVVVSARALNPRLQVVTRATTETAARKLRRAGADRVVEEYAMAGHRLVSHLLRPHVIDFLDAALRTEDLALWLEEIRVSAASPLVGKTLAEANIRALTGANVLAVARHQDERIVDWSPHLRLQEGDILIALGRREQLAALVVLASGEEPAG